MIEFRHDRTVVFKVPASSITQILHSTQQVRRSARAYDYFEGMCCAGTQSDLLPALAGAIAAPLGHSKSHYVELHWYSNGDGAAVLQLAKEDYLPFMDWLQKLSGVQWMDVGQDRALMIQQIKEGAGRAFRVKLEYPTPGDGDQWEHRSYMVLPVDLRGQTELFFFHEKLDPSEVVGTLPVTPEWSDNTCTSYVDVLYGKCDIDDCRIKAVLLPTLTYRVKYPPGLIESDAAGHFSSDCVLLNQQRTERRKQTQSGAEVTARPKHNW